MTTNYFVEENIFDIFDAPQYHEDAFFYPNFATACHERVMDSDDLGYLDAIEMLSY
mgnify:CR=1 FL=1